MGKFKLTKRVKLDYLGDDWKDCYIDFRPPSFKDVRKIVELGKKDEEEQTEGALNFLKERFIDGRGISENGEKIDIKAEDIDELPIDVLTKIMKEISGEASPNA